MNPFLAKVQRVLAEGGYTPGPADGLWGSRTKGALTALIFNSGREQKRATPPAAPPAPLPTTGSVIYQGKEQYPVREVCVHCSATKPDWFAERSGFDKVEEITLWHVRDRGWRTIGYHWIIDRDGKLYAGRKETEIGAGVEGHNRGVIHVCLIGGHGSASTDRFSDHFTEAQDRALRDLLQGISMRTSIRKVSGHNEYANKACPGFNAAAWFKGEPSHA